MHRIMQSKGVSAKETPYHLRKLEDEGGGIVVEYWADETGGKVASGDFLISSSITICSDKPACAMFRSGDMMKGTTQDSSLHAKLDRSLRRHKLRFATPSAHGPR